jgi:hypothetical protein
MAAAAARSLLRRLAMEFAARRGSEVVAGTSDSKAREELAAGAARHGCRASSRGNLRPGRKKNGASSAGISGRRPRKLLPLLCVVARPGEEEGQRARREVEAPWEGASRATAQPWERGGAGEAAAPCAESDRREARRVLLEMVGWSRGTCAHGQGGAPSEVLAAR